MPQKKKILHIIQSLDNGGCENMLLRTLPRLNQYDHKIITLQQLGALAPQFVSSGIAVETIRSSGLLDIFGFFRLRKAVEAEHPAIVLTYLFHADMIGRLALGTVTQAPIIPFLRTTYNHPKYLIARILEWLTKPLVRQYLANSEAVKHFYTEKFGVAPEKITVIPNGIDTDYFDSVAPNPTLRTSLGIKPTDFVIVCVANLHQNKGHRYLLEAFESLHSPSNEAIPAIKPFNLKLLIVGDGAERENLKNQVKEYASKNKVSFLGRRTDVPELLKISDCFVLPTLFEGMSNAIMEAMASGLPVITTDIPENRALVENNKTGILIPKKDATALAQAIERIVVDSSFRKYLSDAAYTSIKTHFDLPVAARKIQTFFESQ